jgi:hypothetical protein
MSLNEPSLDYPDTGDIVADLRAQIHSAVDLLGRPPFGPLFRSLIGEAQDDPQIAAALNERLITPQTRSETAHRNLSRTSGACVVSEPTTVFIAVPRAPLPPRALLQLGAAAGEVGGLAGVAGQLDGPVVGLA